MEETTVQRGHDSVDHRGPRSVPSGFEPIDGWPGFGRAGFEPPRSPIGRGRTTLPRPPGSFVASAGALGGAFALNVALQGRPASIAMLAAIVVAASAVLASPDRRRPEHLVPIGLAVAAGVLVVVRSSPWVVGPALAVAAWGLVVGGQGRPLRWGRPGAVRWLAVDVRQAAPWLIDPLTPAELGGPGTVRAVRGAALAAAAVVPLTWLLATADAAFAELLATMVGGEAAAHVALTAVLAPLVAAPILAARRDERELGPAEEPVRRGSMVEVTMVLGAVALVLGAWGATQIAVAVGGAERLLATADLTAAENARSGFFQLVAAVALLVAIVAGADRIAERATPADRRRFLVLTGLIGVETLGLVAATYSRLALYVQGFGTTMLRLSVAWFLAWLAVAMVVIVVAVNARRLGARHAGPALAVVAAGWVLAFGFSNPEASVASRNLDGQSTAELDLGYLMGGLGADAVPTIIDRLDELPSETRPRTIAWLCFEYAPGDDHGPASWNRSVDRANDLAAGLVCDP